MHLLLSLATLWTPRLAVRLLAPSRPLGILFTRIVVAAHLPTKAFLNLTAVRPSFGASGISLSH